MDINNWLDLLAELDRAEKNWHRYDVTGLTPNQVTEALESASIGQYLWNNSGIYDSSWNKPIAEWAEYRYVYFKHKEDITVFRLIK